MSGAAVIARALKGKRSGSGWIARCPAHKDRNPSFSISDVGGMALFRCHAGCTQQMVMNALRALGLWGGDAVEAGQMPRHVPDRSLDEAAAARDALTIWDAAQPAKGTRVEAYLCARSIRVPPPYWSELRYAPNLRHAPTKTFMPAMIARLSDERGFVGIQRTYLDRIEPRKADVMPNKMTKAPMRLAAVRFGTPDEALGLAEGIETALSARQLYGTPTWAVLSCTRLKQIEIPKTVKFITIFGDQDRAGKAAAFEAADDYEGRGFHAEVIFPASDFETGDKADFNTILKEQAARKYDR